MFKGCRTLWICPILLVFCGALAGKTLAQNIRPLASYEDQFQTEKIPRNGFGLYYRSLGSGTPVLILSGGPGEDCDYMLPVASEIGKYAHAILLEQRGTGRSIPPQIDGSTINLELYLEDFEALRIHLNVQRWTIVGHSAGGFMAMAYAASYPKRVDKLILLDSAPVASQYFGAYRDNILDRLSPEERVRLATLNNVQTPQAAAALAQLGAEALFFNRTIGDEVAGELGRGSHADVSRLLEAEILAPGYDLRPRLKDFDRPVLVVNGRQDPMDPLIASETSAAFNHSTLKFIDRAGHFPWFEQPTEFDEILRVFLTSR